MVYVTLSIVFIICVFYIIISSLLIHGARTVSIPNNILLHLQPDIARPPRLPDPLAGADHHLYGVSGLECYCWSDSS